ncbi:SMI1/KNR4 family protein [Streptomyces sp. NPDC055692]|uniref:SMI1/KNR4 family protein n=1 Tax=Streptomyces sp. NPDC055692 TaxID=3155683 RepID=UPI00341EBC0E
MMHGNDVLAGGTAVTAAWDRIETWLQAHAPMSRTTLRPPATCEQLNSAERVVGCPLPDQLKALWLLHDGTYETPGYLTACQVMVGYQEMLALPLPTRLRWLWDRGAESELYREPPAPADFAQEPDYAEMLGSSLSQQIQWLWERGGRPLPALLVGDGEEWEDVNTFLDGEGLLQIDQALAVHATMTSSGEWPRTWIPFTADNPEDAFAGLFLDSETGRVGRWGLMDVSTPGGETVAGYLARVSDGLAARG